jgi:hypothetical protein
MSVTLEQLKIGAIIMYKTDLLYDTSTRLPDEIPDVLKPGQRYRIEAVFSNGKTGKCEHDISIKLVKVSKNGKMIGKWYCGYSLIKILRDFILVEPGSITVPIEYSDDRRQWQYLKNFYINGTPFRCDEHQGSPQRLSSNRCYCKSCLGVAW